MRWLAVLVATTGCIEGDDPNACYVETDCDRGEVCSVMDQCVPASSVRTVAVQWFIDDQMPSPEAPGRCADAVYFGISVGLEGTGTALGVDCEAGQATFDRVPDDFDRVRLAAYGPDYAVLGFVDTPLPVDIDAAVVVRVWFPPR